MKAYRAFRRLLSAMLAAGLFLFVLPRAGAAEESAFRKITTLEELTTGQYVLMTGDGYAPGALAEGWVSAVQPNLSEADDALWTLTAADGTVILTDSRSVAVAPESGGENGITAGECRWNISCADGLFSFYSVSGEEPVTFAANRGADHGFRAYRDSTINDGPDSYCAAFSLYQRTDLPAQPEDAASTTGETVTISAISEANAAVSGSITIQGTVILADGQSLILQDSTGGIRAAFGTAPDAVPGDVLTVTGTLSEDGALTVTGFEKTGTAPLPAAEVTIDAIAADETSGTLENTRVLIRGAVLGEDALTAGEASIPIVPPLPTGVAAGDTADVYAVVLRDGGYVLRVISAIPTAPADAEVGTVLWNSVAPEDILLTDTIAVTMTKDGVTWALSSENGEDAPPDAVAVTVEGGNMRSASANGLSWNLRWDEAGLMLYRAGSSEAWLYTHSMNNGVRCGTSGDGHWIMEEGYLKHTETRRFLSVYQGSAWRALTHHESEDASGQSLAFWRLEQPETVAEVTVTPAGGEISAGDPITLTCADESASIFFATSSDGESWTEFAPYSGPILPETGFGRLYVKAYAAKPGGTDSPQTLCVFAETAASPWNVYFGQLHTHTTISDGIVSVEDAFSSAAKEAGMDFLAVTDHSNSFDNGEAGAIDLDGTAISAEWAAGKAAAAAATDDSFVGIFGYEMTWTEGQGLGHISTFNTPGWQSREQAAYTRQPAALESYYKTLTSVPGSVSQFNHPGPAFGTFEFFAHYSAEYDEALTLLEVGGQDGSITCEYYNQALDAGWHLAPTNNPGCHRDSWGSGRTVILAEALTEEALYDAMKNRRVYATGDSDLTVLYELNGSVMGSIRNGPLAPEVSLHLSDPTDGTACRVEVIADGGAVVAEQTVPADAETVTFSAPSGHSYYYLRLTQPDGDIAVTAPVWVDDLEDMGIKSFTCNTPVPAQNQEVSLTIELFNGEKADFLLESLEITADGEVIHTAADPGTVAAMDTLSYTFPYTHPGMGVTEFRATVTGTVNGARRVYEETLTLRYRVPELVTKILVDGAHGNAGAGELTNLSAIASDAHVGVTIFTGELPESGSLLLVSAPSEPFDPAFLSSVAQFVRSGGSVILCGQSDASDGTLHSAVELNRLLSAIGSTLRLNDDTAVDPENNIDAIHGLTSTVFNTASDWCAGLTTENVYMQNPGCTVEPGSGTWLVKGHVTARSIDADGDGLGGGKNTVLLACEETGSGGTVFVSGGPFLTDSQMSLPDNFWDPVSINQFLAEKLLDIERTQWPLSSIADVRCGEAGEVYRIRGFATSGTANPYNTFADTLYLQDSTGGIAIVPFTQTGIEIGTPLEVIGYLATSQGNPVLEIIGYEVLEEDFYRFVPKTTLHDTAMDYGKNGGRLMQVEGTVVGLTRTADNKGISRILLADRRGNLAEVMIEDTILSGAYGVNDLASQVKMGRTVRAMGILHLDGSGNPVLRVRNCDEVVYVPPVATPDTGDSISIPLAVMLMAAEALALLPRRRKRR